MPAIPQTTPSQFIFPSVLLLGISNVEKEL
jgi:hypothetical protein